MTRHTWRLSLISLFIVSVALVLSLMIVSADFGTNWTGQFYNCIDLNCSSVATESYPAGLNFDWDLNPEDADGTPIAAVQADNFSARFTSSQTFVAGTYEFQVTATDGVRLYIDGVLTELNSFTSNELTTYVLLVELSAGDHTLQVDYFNDTGDAFLQVQWFFDTSATATPAPTATPNFTNATVQRVNGLALRTGPFLGASLIGVLRPGNNYRVTAQNNTEGLFTWYYVTTESGYEGWASGRYLVLANEDFSLPEIGSDFDVLKGLPNTGVIAVPRANMNVRIHPSTRTGRITQLAWGEEANIVARTIQGGKDFWYLVRFGDVTGWIYAPYIGVRGDILNVPIY